jgi:hypothetical protein
LRDFSRSAQSVIRSGRENMQIWEYQTIQVRLDSPPGEIIAPLNLQGEGGWELVQMVATPASVDWIAIFKRPKVM